MNLFFLYVIFFFETFFVYIVIVKIFLENEGWKIHRVVPIQNPDSTRKGRYSSDFFSYDPFHISTDTYQKSFIPVSPPSFWLAEIEGGILGWGYG